MIADSTRALVVLAALFPAACVTAPAQEAEMSMPELQVVILGIAQDGGVPQIGDHCDNCVAARVHPGRAHRVAALGIIDRRSGKAYLIDATPDLPAQWDHLLEASRFPARGPRTGPDGIFLTHAHMGHYLGLAHLGREAFGAKGTPVYGTERMIRHLSGNAPWEQLVRLGNVSLKRIEAGEPVVLREGLTVTPISSPHRQEYSDTVAYVIEGSRRLLYVPDTDGWEEWSPTIEELCRDADYAILDGTFFSADELPGRDISRIPHPLVTQSVEMLQDVVRDRPGSILFIHLNHSNPLLDPDGEERAGIEKAGFRVAEEGMGFPL